MEISVILEMSILDLTWVDGCPSGY